MSQQEAERSDAARARRHKPFDDERDARREPLESAYHDPRVAELVATGEVDAARERLIKSTRSAAGQPEPYLDLVRLERGLSNEVWQRWAMRGLASCPELAPKLLASVPEDALRECALQQHIPWRTLSKQRDRHAAGRLFAMFVGELLWHDQLDDAVTAVSEPSLREQAQTDSQLRTLLIAVLTVRAWRDPAGMRQTAAALGVSLPEPDPSLLPSYPMDALEHAALLGEALRRVRVRVGVACPPGLARAIELGPFFGGQHARMLRGELATELRERPDEALRFCDAAVETSGALGVYLGEAIAELAHETGGSEAPPEERPARVVDDLARNERLRRAVTIVSAVSSVACAAAFAARGQLQLGLFFAAPLALGAWASMGFFRQLAYLPRIRPALARVIGYGRRDLPTLHRTLRERPELAWVAERVERDAGLWLLGALAGRAGTRPPGQAEP